MILPISYPGLWKKLPWMLFSPMSPMKIRLRYLPQAVPWLTRFVSEAAHLLPVGVPASYTVWMH